MATSGSIVEFCEDSGDGLETFGKPYTTLLKYEVMTYGVVRVLRRIVLNAVAKVHEEGIVEELLFKFLQKKGSMEWLEEKIGQRGLLLATVRGHRLLHWIFRHDSELYSHSLVIMPGSIAVQVFEWPDLLIL